VKRMVSVALATCFALVLAGCGTKPAPAADKPVEVVVSAAASLTDAMKDVQTDFEANNRSIKLRFNVGSSGSLQQQIEQGAPVDLFISAATEPMDALVKKSLVDQSAVQNLVTNKVVLIRGKTSEDVVKTWDDLKSEKVHKIAIGNPQHVPAGQYAQSVLVKLNLWSSVEKRLVLGEDVRQVLNYVESGEVQAGIVYSTDAAVSQKVIILAEAPAGSHPPVLYPMAVLKDAKHGAQAKAFADYLLSAKGMAFLTKYGFGPAN
jgi:molybdate transport system substrate-binding protein